MGLLTGKTALITGAARGIGKAIAIKFASEGANIAFTDLVIDENGKATEAEISALGVKCKGYASNAADFAQSEEVVKQVKEEFGSIDVLVNNAGITRDGLSFRMKLSDWEDVLRVNLTGVFVASQIVSSDMIRKRAGSIINMTSIVGLHGQGGQVNYSASKAGLIGFTKSLAKETAGRGVRVNAIAPGYIETDMTAAVNEEMRKAWVEGIPLKRAGQPLDIANAAVFLASDLSLYITAQVLGVDGGLGA